MVILQIRKEFAAMAEKLSMTLRKTYPYVLFEQILHFRWLRYQPLAFNALAAMVPQISLHQIRGAGVSNVCSKPLELEAWQK